VSDPHIGGEDFDNRLVDYFLGQFKEKHKIDISHNTKSVLRLKKACEKAKRELTSATQAFIELDSLYEGIDFHTSINREKFEELILDLLHKCLVPLETVQKKSWGIKILFPL
jgi:heat shock protein 1/8